MRQFKLRGVREDIRCDVGQFLLRAVAPENGVAVRVAAKAGDHRAMPAWLPGAKRVDLPQKRWRLLDQPVGDGNGSVDIGQMLSRVIAFAMFQRDLEGALLPDVFQRVEMTVRESRKAEVARLRIAGIGARRSRPEIGRASCRERV